MKFALILFSSILLDQILGDPKNFPHPVKLIGRVINFFKKIFLTEKKSFAGGFALCVMTIGTTIIFLSLVLNLTGCNIFVEIYFLYAALAWRDLKDETAIIFFALLEKNLSRARKFLSYVVGRDTENLTEKEIARAVIETIAENSIDGIISVIFFAAVGNFFESQYGMILAVWIFKTVSTLDSMIGYESYKKFGTFGAKLDDVLNFLPARLGGLVIIFSGAISHEGCKFFEALKIFLRDRMNHKSPNSAHGESAFAGILGIELGGGAFYQKKFEARPAINSGARSPETLDIVKAWKLLDVSCSLFAAVVVLLSEIR